MGLTTEQLASKIREYLNNVLVVADANDEPGNYSTVGKNPSASNVYAVTAMNTSPQMARALLGVLDAARKTSGLTIERYLCVVIADRLGLEETDDKN